MADLSVSSPPLTTHYLLTLLTLLRVRVVFIQLCQQDGMKMELCLECLGFVVCRFLILLWIKFSLCVTENNVGLYFFNFIRTPIYLPI